MESSWIYASKGKAHFFPEEMELPFDPLSRNRKPFLDWDYTSETEGLISNAEADAEPVDSMGFIDSGFSSMLRKNSPCGLTVSVESVSDANKRVASPTRIVSANTSVGEEKSRPKPSRSPLDANSQESSLIDLKLGRLADCKEPSNNMIPKETSVVSSVGSSLPTKRAHPTGPYSQAPFCQVHGCNKDLSSAKDYHKRHRVCDLHSKTAKVIVNGIEQRFCQQCSRFHLLSEFDNNKRSCRRRLAGHNERRRKPQIDTLSGRPQKLLASYQGTRFSGTSLPNRASLVFSNINPGGIFYPGGNEQANQHGQIKQFKESYCSSQLQAPLTNAQLLLESDLNGPEKQLSSRVPPSGTQKHAPDSVLPFRGLSQISNSTCALSLLSAQSGNWTSQSTRVAVSRPPIIQGSQVQHRVGQNSITSLGGSTTEKYTPDELYSCGMDSVELDQMSSVIFSDSSHPVNSNVHIDANFQGSDSSNAKYCLSPKHGSTVDLLQLSLHLQRVERQRNFVQVKPETRESFGSLGI